MSIQEQIMQRVANLPEHLQREVLDFILFLEWKYWERQPPKKSLAAKLMEMPDVGLDEDFERVQDTGRAGDVFD